MVDQTDAAQVGESEFRLIVTGTGPIMGADDGTITTPLGALAALTRRDASNDGQVTTMAEMVATREAHKAIATTPPMVSATPQSCDRDSRSPCTKKARAAVTTGYSAESTETIDN